MINKILIFLLVLTAAYKAEANISVFPYSIDFDAASNKRVQTVRVINTSDETQTYRVSFVNFKQDENGGLTEIEDKNGLFANKYLNWSPRQFTLKPNEVQTINIARKTMAQAPDGEFVSHLRIGEVSLGKPKIKNQNQESDTLSTQLKALFAITLPVTICKGTGLISKTSLKDYKLLANKNLQLTLKREGNRTSKVNISVLNDKGKEIGKLNNVKIYLSTDKLNITLPLNKELLTPNALIKLEDARTKENILQQAISL